MMKDEGELANLCARLEMALCELAEGADLMTRDILYLAKTGPVTVERLRKYVERQDAEATR